MAESMYGKKKGDAIKCFYRNQSHVTDMDPITDQRHIYRKETKNCGRESKTCYKGNTSYNMALSAGAAEYTDCIFPLG